MEIKEKWVVAHALPNFEPTYFVGLGKSETREIALFERLSSRTRLYKSERGANQAARIANENYESPYIKAEFIKHAEVDVIEDKPQKSDFAIDFKNSDSLPELVEVPVNEHSGWIRLDRLCGMYPAILRKGMGEATRFAIAYSDKNIKYLPADEVFAWARYFDECKQFVTNKIKSRRIAEGRDPDGADEWKKVE